MPVGSGEDAAAEPGAVDEYPADQEDEQEPPVAANRGATPAGRGYHPRWCDRFVRRRHFGIFDRLHSAGPPLPGMHETNPAAARSTLVAGQMGGSAPGRRYCPATVKRSRAPYRSGFFDSIAAEARSSAQSILPIVLDLVPACSVVDVGCGTGEWLAAAGELGGDESLGIEGDHVPPEQWATPADRFLGRDVNGTLAIGRTFDLVISLEVAEHLEPS